MMQASLTANGVFNIFSFTAIILNIVTILALSKPLTIPRNLKTLLMSLVVSDLGVSLLSQPLYVAYLSCCCEKTLKHLLLRLHQTFGESRQIFLLMPRSLLPWL